MRIIVANSSGNVGKSLVAREVLYSFANGSKIVEIETVNASSVGFNINVEKIEDFTNFEEIYMKIIENDNLILDIGASNLGAFLDKMSEFAGVETMFDAFVIPTIPSTKVMTDTAKTIQYFKSIGIANSQIKVIFNNSKTLEDFNILLMQEAKLDYKFDTDLVIPETKLFNELGLLKKTINEIYNEDVNAYKELILTAPPTEKLRFIKSDLANRMAVSIYPKLKLIYERITGESATNNLVNKPSLTTVEVVEKAPKKAEKPKVESVVSDDDEEL